MHKLFLLFFIISTTYAYDDFYYVPSEPTQEKVEEQFFKKNGFILKKLYKYNIKARVVSNKKYSWDNLSSIASHDMGVTWGELSKTNVFNLFNWHNNNRLLYFSGYQNDIDKFGGFKKLGSQLANIHLIPRNWIIEGMLNKVNSYDVIEINGYLVDIIKDDKIYYTSDSRTDEGAGACEIIYVDEVKILHKSINNEFYSKKKDIFRNSIPRNNSENSAGEGTRAKKYSQN